LLKIFDKNEHYFKLIFHVNPFTHEVMHLREAEHAEEKINLNKPISVLTIHLL
jgi:hypothetical protein